MRRLLVGLLLLSVLHPAFAGSVLKTVQEGSTDVSVVIKIIDSSDGTPETGVVFNSAGIDLEYWRHGANAVTDITEVTQTINGAHTDGGFVAVGYGMYRLDLPDAAVASGADAVEIEGTVTGMIVIGGTVQIVGYDPTDSVRLGLTALPNANADAAGGLPISDAGALDLDTLNSNISAILTDTSTTLDDFVDDLESRLGTPSDFGSGTLTIAANLEDIADNGTATFDRSTDSLQAIRDRGDTTWITASCSMDFGCITQGTAQAVTGTTIQLAAAENFDTDDEIIGATVVIATATTGAGQSRTINSYTNTTDTATVDTWTTTPTGTITYRVFGTPPAPSSGYDSNVLAWNSTLLSMTNPLPNAAADAAGGLIVSDTGGLDADAMAASVTNIETDTNELQTDDYPARFTGIEGATFSTTTDSLEALRNRGDTAWATGASQASVDTIDGIVDAILVDTSTTLDDFVDDLETRLTATRAGYLDNLSAGAVALEATAQGVLTGLEMHILADAAFLNCEVNTANFAGSTTTLACILTDRDDMAVTQATGDLEGLQLVVLSGAQIREARFIRDTTWDSGNSELQLTLSRALPATLADAVTAIIR